MLPTPSLLPMSLPQDPKPLRSTLAPVSPEQLHQEWEEKQEWEWLQLLYRGGETKREWGEEREWEEQLLQEWFQKIHRWWEEEQDREEKRESDEKQECIGENLLYYRT